MQLLIIRHAIAEDRVEHAAHGLHDDQRPLTAKGVERMRQGAAGLRRVVPRVDVLAASPLKRAQQTAAIVQDALDAPHPMLRDELSPESPIDIFLLDVRKPIPYPSWNSAKIQWAVKVEGSMDGQPGDKWRSCEIALPLEDVVRAPNTPPRPGDRWLMNMYRVEKQPERASLAWSPTGKDFHQPEKFGEIVFTDRRVP